MCKNSVLGPFMFFKLLQMKTYYNKLVTRYMLQFVKAYNVGL